MSASTAETSRRGRNAIAVTFDEPIEPYSDEEGLVPGRVEDAGFDRRGTVVSPDRKTIYVTVSDEEIDSDRMERLCDLLFNGWNPTSHVHKDIAYADFPLLAYEGSEGQPVSGITRVAFTHLDSTDHLFHSAAIAAKSED